MTEFKQPAEGDLHAERFVCNMIEENCYVLSDSTSECVIIDCGAFYPEERRAIVDYIRDNKLTPRHLIATHGHIDHNFGNNTIYEQFGLQYMVSTITFGTHRLRIIPTPGHTPGSVFFYCEEEGVAFSGDTLFRGSIGRTDLEGGSMFQIIQSLRTISQLPDTTIILPGHGESTTMGQELDSNPYLDR